MDSARDDWPPQPPGGDVGSGQPEADAQDDGCYMSFDPAEIADIVFAPVQKTGYPSLRDQALCEITTYLYEHSSFEIGEGDGNLYDRFCLASAILCGVFEARFLKVLFNSANGNTKNTASEEGSRPVYFGGLVSFERAAQADEGEYLAVSWHPDEPMRKPLAELEQDYRRQYVEALETMIDEAAQLEAYSAVIREAFCRSENGLPTIECLAARLRASGLNPAQVEMVKDACACAVKIFVELQAQFQYVPTVVKITEDSSRPGGHTIAVSAVSEETDTDSFIKYMIADSAFLVLLANSDFANSLKVASVPAPGTGGWDGVQIPDGVDF